MWDRGHNLQSPLFLELVFGHDTNKGGQMALKEGGLNNKGLGGGPIRIGDTYGVFLRK